MEDGVRSQEVIKTKSLSRYQIKGSVKSRIRSQIKSRVKVQDSIQSQWSEFESNIIVTPPSLVVGISQFFFFADSESLISATHPGRDGGKEAMCSPP